MALPVGQQHTPDIINLDDEEEFMSTTSATPSKDEHLRPSINQLSEHQHEPDIINLDDEDGPILNTSVPHNSHEHLPPKMNQSAGHLHPPVIIELSDDDDKDTEDESKDEYEIISDLDIPDQESEGENEDESEASESNSESEPELDFGPAKATDNDDAAMLQRLLEEKRAPLGAAFRDMAIQINDKKRGPRGTIGMATSYLDQDTSGTYDPGEQRRHIRPNKRNRPYSRRVINENGLKKVSAGNSIGYELKVTFQFKKESSLNYLRFITPVLASNSSPSSDNNSSSAGSSDSDSGNESDVPAPAPAPVPPKRKYKKRRKIKVQAPPERYVFAAFLNTR